MSILVIGSFMMDQVVLTPRAPENGETIIGEKITRHPGGKGANQAVAASRLGAEVKMAGKTGSDEFGDIFMSALKKEKIDTKLVLKDPDEPTGIGIVVTETNGDNRIVVIPGANLAYDVSDLKKIEREIKESSLVILQLEMNQEVVDKSVEMAYQNHIPVILNPAPARKLSDQLLSKVAYLTPNETELGLLTNSTILTVSDAEQAAQSLVQKGVKTVIVTLASKGALIVKKDYVNYIPGFPVKAVDSVAAGDAFNGALAVKIKENASIEEAVTFANAVGALTVTREGAIPSLPTLGEVEAFRRLQTK